MKCRIHLDGQDIFVEVDWMTGHRMEETAQNLVIRAFGRHNITLHIDVRYALANQRLACILGNKIPADDGCMHGDEKILQNDMSDDDNTISVSFEVWDRDIISFDDQCDISRNGKACDITYSLEEGTWSGDDALGDENGYGHCSGEEDGSAHKDEDDCEMWFDIKQNDYDGDGLTWWEEVNVYGTDPTEYTRNWLFMVYMDGDNNLESAAIEDINEMEEVGSTNLVNIVVQIDRTPGFDNTNGDWTGARRYYITHDNDLFTINSQLIQDLGEVNMGDPRTLIDFVSWATTYYNNANTHVLVLWNHGGGFAGVCWDYSSEGDYLTMAELKRALTFINTPIDIIGFDACLMQMIEVCYQIRGTGDIMVGSEEVESMYGWPYDDILTHLTANDQMTITDFAATIVADYIASYDVGSQGNDQDATLSAVRINNVVTQLTPAIDNFAQQLLSSLDQWQQQIKDARTYTETYLCWNYKDIFDFAFEVNQRVNDENVQGAAQNVMNAITNAVVAEGHLTGHPDSHGLAIYLPTQAQYDMAYENLDFAVDTNWDEFLRAIGA